MKQSKRFSRRTFLAASAAAAAPMVVPARVFGANDKINLGYIGTGRRSGQLRGVGDDVQVVALADVNLNRMKEWRLGRWGRTYGLEEKDLYQDFREMLARVDLDAVIVGTPDHWHALHAIHAMRAGKDVYVEKPMTLTIREGRLMTETAREHGRMCQVGSQQRTMRANRIGCALVREGRIGKVHTVHAANYPSPWECTLPQEAAPDYLDWDMWCGPTQPRGYNEKLYVPRGGKGGHEWGWISFRPYSGGEMTGWGAHGLDQIQWALGKDHTTPVEVWPELDNVPPDDGIHKGPRCVVCMKYADGTVLRLDGRAGGGGGWFEGEDGEIVIDRGKYSCKPDGLDEPAPELPEIAHEGDTDAHIANWVHSIRTRALPVADVEIGHRSTILCHLGNIARWLRRKAVFDPQTETFPGDDEANALLDRKRRAPWTL